MNPRLLIVGALAITAFAAAFVLSRGSDPAGAASPVVQAPSLAVEQVLVAAQDLPMGSVLTETGATWQDWPKADVSELMITKKDTPDPAKEIFGSMLHSAFIRGEPIRTDKLVRAGSGGFLSAILPTGMRAVAIKIENGGDTSAGGFILPNDRVDVVALLRDEEATKARGVEVIIARTILTNVRVLAVGQNVEEQNGKKMVTGAANATLELAPDQADLILLAQHGGAANIHLVLRSLADSVGPAKTVATSNSAKDSLTFIRYGAAQTIQ
jgi:pilus assembly protein CpaB